MARKRYSDEEIQKALEQYNQGKPAKEVAEDMDVNLTTFYNWKRKHGAGSKSKGKGKKRGRKPGRPKGATKRSQQKTQSTTSSNDDDLRRENEKLKILYAEAMLKLQGHSN